MPGKKTDPSIDNRYLNTLERKRGKIILASRPYHIQLETTTKCNLNCIMCNREKYQGKGKHLNHIILEKLFEEVFPYLQEVLLSSFGEPLLYPHLGELLDSLQRFQKLDMGFYTNLIPLTEEKAEQIVRNKVAYLCVSIDGATKETYEAIRKNARWEKLIENLEMLNVCKKRFKSRRPFLHLVIVGMTKNIPELPLFVDFAKRYGFGAIKVSHNLYVDDESMEYLSLVHEKALANRMYAKAYERAIAAGIRNNFHIIPYVLSAEEAKSDFNENMPEVKKTLFYHMYHFYFRRILPQVMRFENTWNFSGKSWRRFPALFIRKFYRKYFYPQRLNFLGLHPFPNDAPPAHCGNPWTHVRIDVEGKVYACCFNNIVMGDLNTQSFDEIWNSPKYQSLRRSIVTRKFWRSCRKAACNWIEPGASDVYGVEFLDFPSELHLIPNEETEIRVRVRNTSRYRWPDKEKEEGDYFTLSYKLFNQNKRFVMEGARGKMPRVVPPGDTANIKLKVWAIPEPGEYELRLDMVHEGVTWFSERGNFARNIPVKVRSFYKAIISPIGPFAGA